MLTDLSWARRRDSAWHFSGARRVCCPLWLVCRDGKKDHSVIATEGGGLVYAHKGARPQPLRAVLVHVAAPADLFKLCAGTASRCTASLRRKMAAWCTPTRWMAWATTCPTPTIQTCAVALLFGGDLQLLSSVVAVQAYLGILHAAVLVLSTSVRKIAADQHSSSERTAP